MTNLSGKHVSFWIDSTPANTYPSFENRLLVDVAIIGGGIVGLTAATLLKRAGKTVAVIESRQVAAGVSGHTTAKVTALHQLIYADLIKQIGKQKAKLYAESNLAGIEQVASFVAEEQIDCDFSRQSSYTFAEPESELDKIQDEVKAALKLGLPATFVTETSLPFAIAGAIKLENQAQFHVRKYLLHLAKNITGDGSHLFENTTVEKVDEGDSCYVVTDKGIVTAQDVIVATNLPILNQGLFFAKTYAELYDSLRATPFVTVESVKQEADVVTRWIGDRFKGLLSSSFTEVAKGEGKLLTIDNEKVAAYRDEQGTVHAVSATCTHLACIVSWNNAEKSWDCACHGARFSCDGKVIQDPAVKDLEQVVS